jgi:hypothetical protein
MIFYRGVADPGKARVTLAGQGGGISKVFVLAHLRARESGSFCRTMFLQHGPDLFRRRI